MKGSLGTHESDPDEGGSDSKDLGDVFQECDSAGPSVRGGDMGRNAKNGESTERFHIRGGETADRETGEDRDQRKIHII